MNREQHYRIVPCVSREEATSIAACVQNQGAPLACLDMEAIRSRSRDPSDWESIISQKDVTIATLSGRVHKLEEELKERDERIELIFRQKECYI